jgi:flavin reductase (DIM6/NTAB) family NADH-FMN oxidoreductase RutF
MDVATSPVDVAVADGARQLRDALGRFTTGVAVVATRDGCGTPVGLTVNSFVSVSLDPPLVAWCLQLGSGLLRVFCEAPGYAISVLSRDQAPLARRFAQRGQDRFGGVSWRPDCTGAPLLDGAIAHFSCMAHARRKFGDHLLLVGQVVSHGSRTGDPLVFYRGQLAPMVEPARLYAVPARGTD